MYGMKLKVKDKDRVIFNQTIITDKFYYQIKKNWIIFYNLPQINIGQISIFCL